ncbi:MAG: T9SS type A sorting domain-containing protein [Flavobacteriales bacterium]|nr:T9SS type A sorting domain-containing protein [Flavobacteriales bacterium]
MKHRHLLSFGFLVFLSIALPAQNALNFDGSSDGVNCGNDTALDVGKKSFTVEAWIKPESFPQKIYEGSIVIKESNSNNGGFMLRAGDGGKVGFGIGAGTNGSWSEINTTIGWLNIGSWSHIAATYNGVKMRLYVNGYLVDTLATNISVGGSLNTPLTLGYHPTYGRYWDGNIDEVRVWDTAWSDTIIKANMNMELCGLNIPHLMGYYKLDEGTANGNNSGINSTKDYSGNGNNGTLNTFTLSGSSSNWTTGAGLSQDATYANDTFRACNSYLDTYFSKLVKSTTTLTKHIPNSVGCDSVISHHIIITSNSYFTQNIRECDSFTSATGKVYKKSGTYYDILANAAGCDSVITTNLKVGGDSVLSTKSSCISYTSSTGKTYNSSGTYFENFTNTFGCDSIEKLQLTILNPTYSSFHLNACDSVLNPLKTKWLKPGDVHYDTIQNMVGCDSIITTTVSGLTTYHDINAHSCNVYISPKGRILGNSGIFYDTLINGRGCDSIIKISLVIGGQNSSEINIHGCGTAVSPTDGKIFNASTTYLDTLQNASGCDSIITMHVTVVNIDTKVKVEAKKLTAQSSVGQFQWLDCKNGYTEIVGADSAVFENQNSGQYAVEIAYDNCLDTSDCHFITGLFTQDLRYSDVINISPNPSSHGFYIRATNENVQISGVLIYTTDGKLVFSKTVEPNAEQNLNPELPPGIYILKTMANNGNEYISKLLLE